MLTLKHLQLVRASILFLYIDIFPIQIFTKTCYGFLTLNVAYCLEVILFRLIVCQPLRYNWDLEISPASAACRASVNYAAFVNGILNILLDVGMVMLPMPVLWSLRMEVQRKVALSFVFGLGILLVPVSLIRPLPLPPN